MSGKNAPDLSAIVVTPDCFDTVRRTVRHLRAQTARDRLEIVLVAPATERPVRPDPDLDVFAGVVWVPVDTVQSVAAARAAGIRQASAPVIVLTEDHSFPEPEWAQALIDAHRDRWAVVGPAILNENPHSLVSWANLIIDYGEWLAPARAGVRDHLPGHNSAYKRALVLEYGEQLETLLDAESVLHWSLRNKGRQLYLEPRARTRHMNYSDLPESAMARFHSGRLFAATRARGWTLPRRLLYILGSPFIPLVRLARVARQALRPAHAAIRFMRALPLVLLFLIIELNHCLWQ